MPEEEQRPLRVFLCHASADKPAVRDLYKRLKTDGVEPWLDVENLLPGQKWQVEIPSAVRESDVVLICLSEKSINKEGYVQKEISFALDRALEMPEGRIFLIPARLEECQVPKQLSDYQWVDLFAENGYERLMMALKVRAEQIGAEIQPNKSGISELFKKPITKRETKLKTDPGAVSSKKKDIAPKLKDESEKPEPKLERKRKPLRTEYVVAIIGAAATIIAGLLGSLYFGKLFEPVPVPTAEPSATIMPVPPTKTRTPTPTRTHLPTFTPSFTPTITLTPTPVPTEILLLQEDFEDGVANDWQIYYGNVSIERDPDGNHYLLPSGFVKKYMWISYGDKDTNWIDYAFESRIKFVEGPQNLAIWVRADDILAYYSLLIFSGIYQFDEHSTESTSWNGIDKQLSPESEKSLDQGRWYTIRVEIKGDMISAYIDNVYLGDAKFSLPPVNKQGGIGFGFDGGEVINFDDIRVWSLK